MLKSSKVMINQCFILQLGFDHQKENTIFQSSWFDHFFNNLSKLIFFSILTMIICWTTSIYLNSCHSVFWHWQYAWQYHFRKTNVVHHILIVNMLNDINIDKLMLFCILILAMCWLTSIYLIWCHSAYCYCQYAEWHQIR